jgi:hypothetical protein
MGQPTITDFRMHDGSRHFVSLPETQPPSRLLRHIVGLGFAFPYFYLSSAVECWVDFWYRGQRFTINNQFGEYWLFVKNPTCPEAVLEHVASHFAVLLCESENAP